MQPTDPQMYPDCRLPLLEMLTLLAVSVDPAKGGSSRRKRMNIQVQAEIQGLMKTSSPYLLATRAAHSLHRLLALHRYLLPTTSEQPPLVLHFAH